MQRRIVRYLFSASLIISSFNAHARTYSNKLFIYTPKIDQFSKEISFSGLSEMINPMGGTVRQWMLRTWINKQSQGVTHQLYVNVSYYNNWRFYNAASLDNAEQLDLTEISRNVDSCSGLCNFSEVLGVDIADSLLRQRALDGFQVKLYAKSGESLIIDVTPAQIQSELLSTNQYIPTARHWSASSPLPVSSPEQKITQTPNAFQIPAPSSPPSLSANHGANTKAFGVGGVDAPPALASVIGRPGLKGAFIVTVQPNSIAARTGLVTGDVVDLFDGRTVGSFIDLQNAVRTVPGGQAISLRVVRSTGTVMMKAQF